MSKKTRNPKQVQSVGDRIIEGLTELRDTLRAGTPLENRFTVRTVRVPDPEIFDAKRIRSLRMRLQMSQHVFAQLLGISTVLAQSWEQGVREPSPLARRLLKEIERNPRHWQKMVITSSTAHHAPAKRKSA